MKKKYFSWAAFAALMLGMMVSFSACSNEDDPNTNPDNQNPDDQPGQTDVYNYAYTSENAAAWGNYMYQVAMLLRNDGENLYSDWAESYEGGPAFAETFKNHSGTDFPTALSCIEEIIAKCEEIANEVGAAKIGDPMNLYNSGNTQAALYAVESWYSWHSRDDYTNNIWSIRNSYYGTVSADDANDSGDIQENSIYNLMETLNPELNRQIDDAIHTAANAIQAIPQPFRNNINCEEAVAAQEACLNLEEILRSARSTINAAYTSNTDDARLEAIVAQYVDHVVLPTYQSLAEKNAELFTAVQALQSNPSNDAFSNACNAWLEAREPWEKSEGFLFGPVDWRGLDPNMDSWPLDQEGIVNILESGNFDGLEWDENDSSEDVEAAQNVRGFHTLEFLLFMNGEPRTVE